MNKTKFILGTFSIPAFFATNCNNDNYTNRQLLVFKIIINDPTEI
jgi:hypothetical protein